MPHPWLRIPAEDYEAHMRAVGQSQVLRDLFSRAYRTIRPRRLGVVGCTTGNDFELVDPSITGESVGIDMNPEYVKIARSRFSQSAFVAADVLELDLPAAHFDMIHVALVLEYLDPARLFPRIHGWLAEGGACLVISQEPAEELPAVSTTGYESLKALSECMILRTAAEIAQLASEAGLRPGARTDVALPSGKTLVSSAFEKRP